MASCGLVLDQACTTWLSPAGDGLASAGGRRQSFVVFAVVFFQSASLLRMRTVARVKLLSDSLWAVRLAVVCSLLEAVRLASFLPALLDTTLSCLLFTRSKLRCAVCGAVMFPHSFSSLFAVRRRFLGSLIRASDLSTCHVLD